MMKKILFVVTSNQHMGDLAFCHEWIEELGNTNFQFAFLIDRSLKKFIHHCEQFFYYDPANDVRDEVFRSTQNFSPDIVIYASGNGWDLKGHKGGDSHEMLNEDIINTDIPLLAYDTKEGYQKTFLEKYKNHPFFGNKNIRSPKISKYFISLRNSPINRQTTKVKYYKIEKRFIKLERKEKDKILSSFGINKDIKTVLFSIAKGNYTVISKLFYDYYDHLAGLFRSCDSLPVKFVVVTAERLESFDLCRNVIQIEPLDYDQYLSLLKSSDLLLSDTIWSTSGLLAACAGISTALLCNSQNHKNNNETITWDDFHQRLDLDKKQSKDIKRLINQHKKMFIDLCKIPAIEIKITPYEDLAHYIESHSEINKNELSRRLIHFLSTNREAESGELYLSIGLDHESKIVKAMHKLMTNEQRVQYQKVNIQSTLDIDWDDFQQRLNLDEKQSIDIKRLIRQHKEMFNNLCKSPAIEKKISPFEDSANYIKSNPEISYRETTFRLMDFLANRKPIGKDDSYLKLSCEHDAATRKAIFNILDDEQKINCNQLNIQSLLEIDTGYDLLHKTFDKIYSPRIERKAYFKIENLYPYKVFPYGMLDISNYFIDRFRVKDCFVEIDVFDTEKFSDKINGLLFNEDVYQPILDGCKKFRSRYDKIPSPVEIIEKILSNQAKIEKS